MKLLIFLSSIILSAADRNALFWGCTEKCDSFLVFHSYRMCTADYQEICTLFPFIHTVFHGHTCGACYLGEDDTLYVDGEGGNDTTAEGNWRAPFGTIQAALDRAENQSSRVDR